MSPRGISNKPKTAAPDGQTLPPQPARIPAAGFTLPPHLIGQVGAVLLLDACNVFGVNPDMTLPLFRGRGRGPFRELMNWRFIPGNPNEGTPDCVSFVTTGGVKIRYFADPEFPMDPDTENRLRNVFHAFKTDPNTKEIVPLPLPDDLTLPTSAVLGTVDPDHGHQFRTGYLRRKPD